MDPTLEKALLVCGAALVGLNGKIVFDWLKARKNGGIKLSATDCPMHGQHHEDIAELKQCTRHLKSEVAVQDERTQTILKRL
ncbi:MAG: hypothetical protein ACYSR9_14260, partial [Planctomycetota bacterium]